jgi:hypothetical protein
MNVVPLPAQLPGPLLAIDLESLLPFLFVIYWLLSQVFGVLRRGRQVAAPQPRPPRLEPAAGPPRPPAGADDAHVDIARQIEEFLRQASGEPPRRADGGAAPRPVETTRPQAQPTAAGPRRPSTLSPRERDEALRQRAGQEGTRRVDARPPRDRSEPATATDGPRKGAKTSRTTKPAVPPPARSPSLTRLDGDGSGGAASVERHVSEAFGRELPHLAATPGRAATPPAAEVTAAGPSLADDLVRKLRDPASIRELILLREVLDRPVNRW